MFQLLIMRLPSLVESVIHNEIKASNQEEILHVSIFAGVFVSKVKELKTNKQTNCKH